MSQEEFIALILNNNITNLVDVRSTPYGTYREYFSKPLLEKWLLSSNIKYLYLGEELGGKGEISYPEKMFTLNFQQGLDKLISLNNNENDIAIMRAEMTELLLSKLLN